MPPPLISEYKNRFVLKRLTQTWLGGPRLIAPPAFIIIQVLIFTIPAVIVSLINLDKKELGLKWKAIVTGCSVFLVDLCMCLVILLLKKGRNSVNPIEISTQHGDHVESPEEIDTNAEMQNNNYVQESQFLAEEDVVVSEGCLKPSTWEFIAPNVAPSLSYIVALTLSSVSFGLCTPLMISETTSPVLRGFGVLAVCIARYSSVINTPPEVATFDAIDRKHLWYRTFYTSLVGGCYVFSAQIMEQLSLQNAELLLLLFSTTLACLPILWALGILPPLDALFPWTLETVLGLVSGSSPSYFYGGSLVSLMVVIICPIIVFVISRDSLLIILAECLCGYITACDTGRIISVTVTLCEEIPTKSFLQQLLQPGMIIITSLLCVLITWLNLSEVSSYEYKLSFAIITLSITLTSWIFRHFTIARKKSPNLILFPISILHGLLAFFLHIWLTFSIEHEDNEWSSINAKITYNFNDNDNNTYNYYVSTTNHSLGRLVPYLLTIRAYAVALADPGKSSIDFTSAFIYKEYLVESEKASFILVLFIVSLITKGLGRFLKHLKTICSIMYAFGVSTILRSKLVISGVAILFMPISIFSLIIATIVEGATLTPLFTLPIFILQFPRPSSFWNDQWLPRSKDKRKGNVPNLETVDWKIYSEIGPLMACGLCRKAYKSKLKLQRGDCYLARYEDRLLFVKVLTSGWNFAYLQIKGLEMQEQTSCHHQEAATVDERLEKTLGNLNDSIMKSCVNPLSFNILLPLLHLTLPTYSESKSNISPLTNPEDKSTFQDMFYRAFSYLWIKNNPALKGEAYQRTLKMKGPLNFKKGDGIPEINSTDKASSSTSNNEFSLNNALFKCTASTVNFIKADSSTSGIFPESEPSTDTITNGKDNAAFESDEPQPENKIISRQSTRSTLVSPTDNNRMLGPSILVTPGVGLDGSTSTSERLSSIWVKQCVGDVIPPNAVKARVEKLCRGVWNTVIGLDTEKEIDLSDFFQETFLLRLKTISTSRKIDMEEITLKAFRYATKLALDEIYSSASYASSSKVITLDAESEEDVFNQLTLYERDYQFCSPDEIPSRIEQNTNRIITIVKTSVGPNQQNTNQPGLLSPVASITGLSANNNSSVMRMLNYETEGVEFRVGKLDQFTVEGIWANLNLELLYLTSDDDERFSIQNDKILLRNIVTQCAKTPLGYPVYDSVFRVNLFNFSVSQVV